MLQDATGDCQLYFLFDGAKKCKIGVNPMIFVTWDVFVTEYKQMKQQLLKCGSQV